MTQVAIDELRNRALRVGAWSEVRDVRLFKVTSELAELPDESVGLSYSLNSDISMQYLTDDGGLIVTGEYTVLVREGSVESTDGAEWDEQKTVLELAFTMAALFAVDAPEGQEPLEEDELDAFAKTTGQFALHPYAREFVADMTGRMGLPQLHIGMMKLHLDGPNQGGNRTAASIASSRSPTALPAG